MTLKVLHVIARLNLGGTSTYINNLIQSSKTLNIEHLVVTGNVQGSEIEDPRTLFLPHIRIPVLGRRVNLLRDFQAMRAISKIIEEYKPDIINSHTFKAGLLTRLLRTKVPRIHTFHGHLLDDPEFSRFQRRIIVWIERRLARKARVLTVTGENVRKDLQQVGIRHSRWVCIVPGIRQLQRIPKEEAHDILNITEAKNFELIVGWHSRFAPVKNVPLVMELAIFNPHFLFLLSGGGPLFSRYQADHPQNVRLLGWQSPEILFSSCDVVLSTSFNEGIPFSLIEASLIGVPIVATKVGGTEQIVINGKTGFIVKAEIDEITAKLRQIAIRPKLRHELGANAREHALKNFGFEVFAEKYLKLIQENITD